MIFQAVGNPVFSSLNFGLVIVQTDRQTESGPCEADEPILCAQNIKGCLICRDF